jgi:hypothetical protein
MAGESLRREREMREQMNNTYFRERGDAFLVYNVRILITKTTTKHLGSLREKKCGKNVLNR